MECAGGGSAPNCSDRSKQAQSYVKNLKFLTHNVAAHFKVDYLKALSMRRVSDKEDKIDRSFIEGDIDNPYLTFDKDFIYFDDEKDLEVKINDCLNNWEMCEKIANNAHEKFMKYHCTSKFYERYLEKYDKNNG